MNHEVNFKIDPASLRGYTDAHLAALSYVARANPAYHNDGAASALAEAVGVECAIRFQGDAAHAAMRTHILMAAVGAAERQTSLNMLHDEQEKYTPTTAAVAVVEAYLAAVKALDSSAIPPSAQVKFASDAT